MRSRCSVGLRIAGRAAGGAGKSRQASPDAWLAPLTLAADHLGEMPSKEGVRASDKGLLAMSLDEYLSLVDWAGRQVSGDKGGAIPAELAPILERLGVAEEELVETVREFPRRFPRFVGPVSEFVVRAAEVGRRWLHGVGGAARVFR